MHNIIIIIIKFYLLEYRKVTNQSQNTVRRRDSTKKPSEIRTIQISRQYMTTICQTSTEMCVHTSSQSVEHDDIDYRERLLRWTVEDAPRVPPGDAVPLPPAEDALLQRDGTDTAATFHGRGKRPSHRQDVSYVYRSPDSESDCYTGDNRNVFGSHVLKAALFCLRDFLMVIILIICVEPWKVLD